MVYVSLLKGVNVSGKNRLNMAALRKVYENMGLTQVHTYLQSGNILFTDAGNKEEEYWCRKISGAIRDNWGYEVQVLVLTVPAFRALKEQNPFVTDYNPDFLHLTFLFSLPAHPEGWAALNALKGKDELLAFMPDAVYLYCPGGYGRTKLHNGNVESKLRAMATTRNWKTVTALMKLADDSFI